jgi:phosphatidylinositol alpha 1,6-mannosyltransferase
VASLYDDALRARLGAAGRALVAHRSWPSLVDQLLMHYGSLTAPAARAA